jgi:DNA-binding HxlR family transcriptional regulator
MRQPIVQPTLELTSLKNLVDTLPKTTGQAPEHALDGLDTLRFMSVLQTALEVLGDKYSLKIVALLMQQQKQRFVELEDQIEGISPRTLSARLKQLDAYGLVERTQFATIPPKVEYTLTEKGKALSTLLNQLLAWTNWAYPQGLPKPE